MREKGAEKAHNFLENDCDLFGFQVLFSLDEPQQTQISIY